MRILVVLGILFGLLVIPNSASAATNSQHFTVSAEVASFHTLVVDDENRIVQIISNSKDASKIRAYRNYIHNNSVIELTDNLLAQYWQILPEGKTDRLGVAYKYYEFPAIISSKPKPLLATDMFSVL